MQRTAGRLRQILASWMNTEIHRLHWLLSEQYEKEPSFGCDSLIGSDAHFLTLLSPLAQDLGLHLHFAHVEMVMTAKDSLDEMYYGEYGEHSYKEPGEDDFNFNFEDEDGELRVTQVVDLEGMPVTATAVDFSATDDLINGWMADGDPDVSKFELEDDTVYMLHFTGFFTC
jgi:hypothetical protein